MRDEECEISDEDVAANVCTSAGHEAHRQLMRLSKASAAIDAEIARWLVVAEREGVHIERGYGTFLEYAERVLGYRPRTALDRMRVATELEGLPATRAALEQAQVTYSAVREITRVATAETEAAWIEAAAGKTMREIEQLVTGRGKGDLPTDPSKPAITARVLRLELAPEDYALFVQARRALEDEAGERLDDTAVMAAMCRRVLDGSAEGAPTWARHEVAVTVCAECDRATVDAAGQVIEIGPDALALARCDATVLDLATPSAPATVEIPRRIRRHVERRDRLRCVVPGCRSSHELHIHHIQAREDGGTHDPCNLVLVCGNHHRAIHNGRLRLTGSAPDKLRFAHRDGRAYGSPPRAAPPAGPPRAQIATLAELSRFVDHCLDAQSHRPT